MAKVGDDEWPRENGAPAVAAYLASVTEPGEPIYDFGRQSQIYFLADRPPAAVTFYLRPFVLVDGALEETIAELRATAPRYIVDTEAVSSSPGYAFTARLGDYYYPPAFAELLDERYEFVEVVEYAAVYRLLGAEPPP
ncbi:MAG: hypothetical protein GEU80_05675 [Dehalococcoidia bacterium]|nr:hypothetical protein [Dehalococcoidia bacterium]